MNHITLAPVQPDQPSHLMATYGRQAISFVRGRGSYLYTEDGTEYLDALTGIAVCGLGHSHPVIAEAIAEQAATLIHTSNLFEIPWQTAAAQKLAEVSGMQEVFFSNSGAEANEGAIKIARKAFKILKSSLLKNLFMGVHWRRYLQQVTVKFRKAFFL